MSSLPIETTNRMYLAALVMAAAFAGAYIAWGPNTGRRRKKGEIPGLLNLGKSCFVNAILQSLASCSSVVKWMATNCQQLQSQRASRASADKSPAVLHEALFKMLRALNNLRDLEEKDGFAENVSAAEVLQALRCHRWVICNDEQDAHEMFHVLATTLEEELLLHCSSANTPSLADIRRITSNDETRCKTRVPGRSRCCPTLPSLDRDRACRRLPFQGLLGSQLRCSTCAYKSPIRFDTFDSLSLPIPTCAWTPLTLHDCLKHFVMPELVHGVECDKCSMQRKQSEDELGKAKSTFVKQLSFGKFPDVLCIHLQRMAWARNEMPTKRHDHVAFPEFLDVDEFAYLHRCGGTEDTAAKNLLRSLVGGRVRTTTRGDCLKSALFRASTPDDGSGEQGVLATPAAVPPPAAVQPLLSPQDWSDDTRGRAAGAPSASVASQMLLPPARPPPSTRGHVFCLQAVVVHLGNVFSGHFVTYRRGQVGSGSTHRNRWHLCSDTSVREVPLTDVLKSQAYLLLYERSPTGA